jgi:hypothetical protein
MSGRQILLNRQVDNMIIRFNAENIIRQFYTSAGLLTLYIENFCLHVYAAFI